MGRHNGSTQKKRARKQGEKRPKKEEVLIPDYSRPYRVGEDRGTVRDQLDPEKVNRLYAMAKGGGV